MIVHGVHDSPEVLRFAMSLRRDHTSGCTGVNDNHGANDSLNMSFGQEMHAT